jgi:hypothetical protein
MGEMDEMERYVSRPLGVFFCGFALFLFLVILVILVILANEGQDRTGRDGFWWRN